MDPPRLMTQPDDAEKKRHAKLVQRAAPHTLFHNRHLQTWPDAAERSSENRTPKHGLKRQKKTVLARPRHPRPQHAAPKREQTRANTDALGVGFFEKKKGREKGQQPKCTGTSVPPHLLQRLALLRRLFLGQDSASGGSSRLSPSFSFCPKLQHSRQRRPAHLLLLSQRYETLDASFL